MIRYKLFVCSQPPNLFRRFFDWTFGQLKPPMANLDIETISVVPQENREMFETHVLACDQVSFDLPAFEQTLRKWGVKAAETVSFIFIYAG